MADQSVRELEAGERIPAPSTAQLLMQDVPPLSRWPITGSREFFFPLGFRNQGSAKSAAVSAHQRHERFAPHVKTIIEMKKAKATYDTIGRKIGRSGEAIRKYYNKYPDIFKEKEEC